jgi:hypothetical protein
MKRAEPWVYGTTAARRVFRPNDTDPSGAHFTLRDHCKDVREPRPTNGDPVSDRTFAPLADLANGGDGAKSALREISLFLRTAVGWGIRGEELFDLSPRGNTTLAAGLSGFQPGSGGGKTDTLVEGSSLD